jgi:hypothetical protein
MSDQDNSSQENSILKNIHSKERRRINYLFLIISVITLGLASRYFSKLFPGWVELYIGDTLWALNVFFVFAFIFKKNSSYLISIVAYTFSVLIEISQLYHTPWIDNLRTNQFVAVIIGFGFLWSDLICYFIGIGLGIIVESIPVADKFLFRTKQIL